MSFDAAVASLTGRYPWLPPAAIRMMAESFVEHGDPYIALGDFRQSDLYDSLYPGNRRPDGTLRYDEGGYYVYVERARAAVASLGVNPSIFEGQIVEALEGNLGIDELEFRIDQTYEMLIDAIPETREAWRAFYGYDISPEAIFAVALDPELDTLILKGQITEAQIGGAGMAQGFSIGQSFAEQLRWAGLDREAAANFFGEGSIQLEIMNVLAARHSDPDDPFDIEEFAEAAIFYNPEVRRWMRNMVAQERMSFFGSPYRLDRTTGVVTGLIES